MAKKLTSCVIVPLLFVIAVIGLFFASTDPSTWPRKSTELSSTDTKIVPAVSTLWCESVVLTTTDHDFLAYKLSAAPSVSPFPLTRQITDVKVRFGRKRLNRLDRTFFFLSGSVLGIRACASAPNSYLYVFGEKAVQTECLHHYNRHFETVEGSIESEEEDDFDDNDDVGSIVSRRTAKNRCPAALVFEKISVTSAAYKNSDCSTSNSQYTSLNVTLSGYYSIIITSENRGFSSIRMRLNFDRATYNVNKLEQSMHMCTAFSTCVVPLTVASQERVLIRVPPLQDAGKNIFVIHSQCRPRVAIFAFLIVFLPVVMFVVITFVVKTGKRSPPSGDNRSINNGYSSESRWDAIFSPLLPHLASQIRGSMGSNRCVTSSGSTTSVSQSCHQERYSDPPPYDILYNELPPSYNSLKIKKSEAK